MNQNQHQNKKRFYLCIVDGRVVNFAFCLQTYGIAAIRQQYRNYKVCVGVDIEEGALSNCWIQCQSAFSSIDNKAILETAICFLINTGHIV